MDQVPSSYEDTVAQATRLLEESNAAFDKYFSALSWLKAWPERADADGRHHVGDQYISWYDQGGFEVEEYGDI